MTREWNLYSAPHSYAGTHLSFSGKVSILHCCVRPLWVQGVCYGLKELLDNITRQQLAENLGSLLPTVQSALVDPDPGVRQVPGCTLRPASRCLMLQGSR